MSLNGGYAMIKYNSTQEELQIAYRSKKPALFYDENQRAHWAVIEETATQSVDEETQEPITLYKYSYRLLDEESGGSATLYDIVDKNGNKRFIEGNGTPIKISDLTNTYCKWSLSGTHLMLVFGGELNSSTTVSGGDSICEFILPEYIYNKIYPLLSTGTITFKDFILRKLGQQDITIYTYLIKKNNNKISISSNTSVTINSGYSFRFEFDLLIDSD